MWSKEKEIKIEAGYITWIGFSPNSLKLAVTTSSGWVFLFSCPNYQLLRRLPIHSKGINDACWSSDSKLICTVSDDKTATVIDGNTLDRMRKFVGHRASVNCCALTHDNYRLVTGSSDTAFRVWDLRKSRSLHEIGGHTEPITSVSFNYDYSMIMTSSIDGICRIWDSFSLICLKTFTLSGTAISRSCFSPNSEYVLLSSLDSSIHLLDIKTGSTEKKYTGHTNTQYRIELGFINNNVYASSENGMICVWDLQSEEIEDSIPISKNPILAVSFTKNGDHLATTTGGEENTLIISKRK